MTRDEVTAETLDSFYQPGGYPRLGLSPLGIQLSTSSASIVQRQVTRRERVEGTQLFRAHGFAALGARQANELASVYLALRQHFPGVVTDWLNFSWTPTNPRFKGLLGLAQGHDELGLINNLAYQLDEPSITRTLSRAHEIGDAAMVRRAWREYNHEYSSDPEFIWGLYHRDVRVHGTLSLTACLSHPECASALEAAAMIDSPTLNQKGEIIANPLATSFATWLLVHEFSHLVDTAVGFLGKDAVEHVWASMDRVLMSNDNGRARIGWRRLQAEGLRKEDAKLVNYPFPRRRASTRVGMRDEVRRVVGHEIATQIGTYGVTDRWELFAEALALSFVSRDPEFRAKMRPLMVALREVGLASRRRRAV